MADIDVDNNSSRNVLVTLVVLALILLGVILVVSRHGNNDSDKTPLDNASSTTDNGLTMLINAKHQYNADTSEHVVAGEVEMPTACDLLSTDVTVDDSTDPDTVTLIFTTTNSGEECAQTVTTERFKETFTAPEDATINATFNGQPVELNLVPADPGEDLNNFEIYLKG
jgi:hypothetical protein